MALREIRIQGDPILEKVCKPVDKLTDRLNTLIDDMLETMHDANGVGLAAPQVGVLRRIVVIDVEDEHGPYVLINPEITESDGEQDGEEGCLSLPGKMGEVKRPNHVICKALNRNMQEQTIEGTELLARCICHELDHLDGHMYTEKVIGALQDVPTEDEGDTDTED
jgi:peptide deformylase